MLRNYWTTLTSIDYRQQRKVDIGVQPSGIPPKLSSEAHFNSLVFNVPPLMFKTVLKLIKMTTRRLLSQVLLLY